MNLINTVTLEYPRSLWQLRQENPNVSFPADPTDEDLALFNHANVYPAPHPSYDQRTERIEEASPEPDAGGIYRQQWVVRNATAREIADYDAAHRPGPDWATFKSTALNSTSLNVIVAEAFQAAPVAAASLAPALLRAENHGAADFASAWTAICAAVEVPTEVIAGFQQVATACNLPDEFVGALAQQFNLPSEFIMGVAQQPSPPNEPMGEPSPPSELIDGLTEEPVPPSELIEEVG